MISANAQLTGSYDYLQVALSGLIAVSASYAALDFGGRVTATSGWRRLVWLTGGAAAMGFGIWSMHFVGMLAFSLPVPVSYNWPTVSGGTPGRYPFLGIRTLCGEPAQNGPSPRFHRQRDHGHRHRRLALHRHERHAPGRRMPV